MWCLSYVHNTKRKLKKNVENKKDGHDLCETRTYAIKSKIGHRDHLTILPKIHLLIFRGARQTLCCAVHVWCGAVCRAFDTPHRTTHAQHSTGQHSKREREAVMTDDGSQPPIEQLATAVHRGSATRSWCGPLLLVCAARRGCNVVGVLCMLSDV